MNKLTFFLIPMVLAGSAPALGQEIQRKDVLLIDRIETTAHQVVPQRGQSMQQVRAGFGDPDEQHGPVGDPAISRWVYADFTVYFENQWVLRAVINRASDSEALPQRD